MSRLERREPTKRSFTNTAMRESSQMDNIAHWTIPQIQCSGTVTVYSFWVRTTVTPSNVEITEEHLEIWEGWLCSVVDQPISLLCDSSLCWRHLNCALCVQPTLETTLTCNWTGQDSYDLDAKCLGREQMYTFTLDSKLTIQLPSKAKVWGLGLWLSWQSACLSVHEALGSIPNTASTKQGGVACNPSSQCSGGRDRKSKSSRSALDIKQA